MIKHKSNLSIALKELKTMPEAVAHIYKDAKLNNKGPLANTLITLKDLIATSDAPTQASSKILEGFKPHYDATIIKKMKDAGGTIIAKVHSDELGLGGTGEFNPYGEMSNAIDPKRLVGGSSSGSIYTFSDAISLAVATDTGDSVRLPSSYNGKVGYKPSYGAISRYGISQYASSLDTVGMFAHNVNDIIELSKVLYGQDNNDMTSKSVELPETKVVKPKKLSFLKSNNILKKDIESDYLALAKSLEKDGVEINWISIDDKLLDSIDTVYSIISFSEASSNDSNLTGISFGSRVEGKDWNEILNNTRTEKFGQMVQRRFTLGSYFLATDNQEDIFLRAQKVRTLIVNKFNDEITKNGILVFPSSEIAPLKTIGKAKNWHSDFLINANLSGAPSISLPFVKSDNLPVGISLTGILYNDKELLSTALYLESNIKGGRDE